MVSTTDVNPGIVIAEVVVPAVVRTSMDVSNIPVEITEDIVSAEVVPRTALSADVVV